MVVVGGAVVVVVGAVVVVVVGGAVVVVAGGAVVVDAGGAVVVGAVVVDALASSSGACSLNGTGAFGPPTT